MTVLLPLPPKISNLIVKTKLGDGGGFDVNALPPCIDGERDIKRFSNYITLRLVTFTLVIFPGSGHTNVTGITSFAQLGHLNELLRSVFGPSLVHPLRIVSSTASGKIMQIKGGEQTVYRLNYERWYGLSQTHNGVYSFTFKRGLFPSIIIRQRHRRGSQPPQRWSGCIQIFNSGAYNVVGCKTNAAVRDAVSTLAWLLRQSLLLPSSGDDARGRTVGALQNLSREMERAATFGQ